MNKICTSIEQAKKLIGLGINTNTADMHYWQNVIIAFPFRESKHQEEAVPIMESFRSIRVDARVCKRI